MSRQLVELETLLQQLINEHEKLLGHLDAQQSAMRRMDVRAIDDAGRLQEATRLRIAGLESRRRLVAGQLATALRIEGRPTVTRLAEAMPLARERLLELAAKLREKMAQVSSRATIAGRLAGAVLGHLNTVVRIMAGAVEQAGLYTKDGIPKVSARIGVMEAVG